MIIISHILSVLDELEVRLHWIYTHFFCKKQVYKKHEAEIRQELRNIQEMQAG